LAPLTAWSQNKRTHLAERFYDFNVYSDHKRIEHQNPVKRGLVEEPDERAWSSFRSYVYGGEGRVRINQWPHAVMKKKAT